MSSPFAIPDSIAGAEGRRDEFTIVRAQNKYLLLLAESSILTFGLP
jgi:hypothetical protein